MSFTYQPKQTSTSELLAQGLGSAAGQGIQQSISEFNVRKQNRNALSGLRPLFKQANIKFTPEEEEELLDSGLSPELLAQTALNIFKQKETSAVQTEKAMAERQKQMMDLQEKQQEIQGFQNAFQTLEEMLPYTGVTTIPGFKSFTGGGLRRETVEKRENFDKLGFWLTDKVFTHFNKGVVSQPKFKEIKESLAPRADLSERQNRARINALKTISNLPSDTTSKEFDKVADRQIAEVNKIPENAPGEKKMSLEEIFG